MFHRSNLFMATAAALAFGSAIFQPAAGAPDQRIVVAQVESLQVKARSIPSMRPLAR